MAANDQQALMQQQPQQQQQSSQPATPSAPQTGAADALTCQWTGCNERSRTADELYDHVCERHVGRKSTNNLNLQCSWGSCRTTTVKRDHITSHIRVHVPLKPHKCEFCGKSFKRPQDLKKHVKTHADDSVLLRTPENAQQRASMGYQQSSGKDGGFYQPPTAPHGNYGYPTSTNPQGHPGNGGNNTNYGPVFYNVPYANQFGDGGLTESRKRNHDLLDQFFGEAKRRHLDPHQYMDLGSQFGGVQGLPFASGPYSGGFGNGGGYTNGDAAARDFAPSAGYPTTNGSHLSAQQYAMPFTQLKTKNDLISIDQFLEQLQSTVYENPSHYSSRGAMHGAVHGGLDPQLSEMPIGAHPSVPYHGQRVPSNGTSPSEDQDRTSNSHLSTNSPGSEHSHHNDSPVHRANASLYPNLPLANSASSPPSSRLSSGFEDFPGRRFAGGYLQQAQPYPNQKQQDGAESSPTAGPNAKGDQGSPTAGVKGVEIAPKPLEQAAANGEKAGSPSPTSSSEDDAWVQNMRVIESLRTFMRSKIESGDFAESDENTEMGDAPDASSPRVTQETSQELYPPLRQVQAAS